MIELTREGDRLFAQATNQGKLEIHALSDNAFFSDEIDAEMRFDDTDPVNGVVLVQGGQIMPGTRLR